MSDDLLDEATRLADRHTAGYRETETSRIVRALVERVQQAEAERDDLALLVSEHRDALGRKHAYQQSVEAKLDAAQAKLYKLRERVKFHLSGQRNGSGISFILDDVLAILDDKEG